LAPFACPFDHYWHCGRLVTRLSRLLLRPPLYSCSRHYPNNSSHVLHVLALSPVIREAMLAPKLCLLLSMLLASIVIESNLHLVPIIAICNMLIPPFSCTNCQPRMAHAGSAVRNQFLLLCKCALYGMQGEREAPDKHLATGTATCQIPSVQGDPAMVGRVHASLAPMPTCGTS